MQVYLWVIGIQQQIQIQLEQLGLIHWYIQNHTLQHLIILTTGTFPVIQGETGLGQTVLFEHEVGTDQINPDGSTTALTSFV